MARVLKRVAPVLLVSLGLLLLLSSPPARAQSDRELLHEEDEEEEKSSCQGAFDLYFVLDK